VCFIKTSLFCQEKDEGDRLQCENC
jgi:hypothetical protein